MGTPSRRGTTGCGRDWQTGAQRHIVRCAGPYFGKVARDTGLSDDLLGWKAAQPCVLSQWKTVRKAVETMGDDARQDSTWVCWMRGGARQQPSGPSARKPARRWRASPAPGFMSSWPWKNWASAWSGAASARAPHGEEKAAARASQGSTAGCTPFLLGIRGEGVRRWNYATNLHPGGMGGP